MSRRLAIALLLPSLALGCRRPAAAGEPGAPTGAAGLAPAQGGPTASTVMPSGAGCTGRADCPADQLCVAARCRHRATSVSGEVLAATARAQAEAGDLRGAASTFERAVEAFTAASVPVPADILCEAALAALRTAVDPVAREAAVRRADGCFRGSLPGDPVRAQVAAAVGRWRYDGLDVSAFDRPEPPERYFTLEPSRPTADAIEVAIDLPDRDGPGWNDVGTALRGERARAAIADCFVQDWEIHHQRSARAALLVVFETRLRDMGTYDVYDPVVEVRATGLAQEGFEPCLASALTDVVRGAVRSGRGVTAWQVPFTVAAQLR
ncbi:MAG: hypothetical protein NZ898_15690 [Myxococcota bacterium]|nr:hypothetical protein [Myxococcota bacterium]MDW8363967.1 hypothetical protein [Myxococcales bacterium]